jgi:2-iminobutanoate/2-iminopropanoate deaminase
MPLDRQSMPQSADAPGRMEGMVPGVRAGGFLFLSAIRGRDSKTGKAPDDPLEQARAALRNLEAVLAASGATLKHVVKVTLYLHDLERRTEFHRAWMEFFPVDPPARIAIGVADANPAPGGNAHYALDVIALAPE